MRESNNSGGGAGFSGLLTVLFVGLKLCGVIDWSWWWVISPTLIEVGLYLLVFGVTFLVLYLVERRDTNRRLKFARAMARRKELVDVHKGMD